MNSAPARQRRVVEVGREVDVVVYFHGCFGVIAVVTRVDGKAQSCHPDDRREEGSPTLRNAQTGEIPPHCVRRDDTLYAFGYRYIVFTFL